MKKITWLLMVCLLIASGLIGCDPDVTGPSTPEESAFDIKQNSSWRSSRNTSIKIDIVEEGGLWQHHLEHGQIFYWSPLSRLGRGLEHLSLALKLDDGLVHYFWLPKIQRVDKLSGIRYQVTMIDGQLFKGKWITAHYQHYYFVNHEDGIFGQAMEDSIPKPAYLPAWSVKSLVIDATELNFQTLLENNLAEKHPLSVKLKDGREFQGFHGYIVDYCGHWGSTTWHKRLGDELLYRDGDVTQDCTSSSLLQSVSIEEIEKVGLTGNFSQNLRSCREAKLYLTSGEIRLVFLELTSESYGGAEYYGSTIFRDTDFCLLWQDYGGLALPLDLVQTISILKM